jgi:hypothetical protein
LIVSLTLAGTSIFFTAASAVQILFYLLAFAGWLLERMDLRLSILAMPLYFVLANLACLLAFYKFLRGETFAQWEPIRQSR